LFQKHQAKVSTLTYFFCDFNDQRSLEIRTILGSLIKQAVSLIDPLPPSIQEKVENNYQVSQRTPDLVTLFGLLESLIQLPEIAYMVIDGLDECSENNRHQLLTFFTRLINLQNRRIKIIISSRPEIDIMRLATRFQQISLGEAKYRPDIEAYIEEEIYQKWERRKISFNDISIMKEIKDALVKGAEGM